MKVNSLSIVPQDVGCNAKCKYCIAHLTKKVRKDHKRPGINLPKLEKCIKYCVQQGAATAIITSSGETLLGSWTNIENILWLCNKYFGQIDLHTNGMEILRDPKAGRNFSQMIAPYITNVTLTVPHYDYIKTLEHGIGVNTRDLIKYLKNIGLTIRLSCVIHKEGIWTKKDIERYIQTYSATGVDQIVFREMWIPDSVNADKWYKDNYVPINVIRNNVLQLPIDKDIGMYEDGPYIIHNVQVSMSTCTSNNIKKQVKSLVYRFDNNLYPDWDIGQRLL